MKRERAKQSIPKKEKKESAIDVIVQALFIGLTILVLVLGMNEIVGEPVLFTSLAATTYVIYMHPKSKIARPRNILFSHLTAATVGFLVVLLWEAPLVARYGTVLAAGLMGALAVTIASVLIDVGNVEHPPAAGTALAFSYNIHEFEMISTLTVALLMIIGLTFLKKVVDLYVDYFEKVEIGALKWLRYQLARHKPAE